MVLPTLLKEKDDMKKIIMESHLIKLLDNKEHVVDILEEIIEFNTNSNEVANYVCLVEMASNDLKKMADIWRAESNSSETFSEEKLFYILYKTMEALEYLHAKNI